MSRPAPATPLSPLPRSSPKVTASDITDQMLAEAKKLAAERGLGNVKTARAKAEDLPFPDMSFDLVTCRLAAHHFDKPRAFVAEAFRVLMPGGVLALVDNISPDRDPELSPAQARSCAAYNHFEKLRDPSHGRCLGLAEWTALLGDAGFAVSTARTSISRSSSAPGRSACAATRRRSRGLRRCSARSRCAPILRPRESDGGLVFTLQEAIIVARKPA